MRGQRYDEGPHRDGPLPTLARGEFGRGRPICPTLSAGGLAMLDPIRKARMRTILSATILGDMI